MMNKKAIILLSGGLDSTTVLAIAKSQGYDCYALSFTYGQKHDSELQAAKTIAIQLGAIEHRIFTIPIGELGGSALTDTDIPVPDYSGQGKIPLTYVPARNTIFLSIALAWAEIVGACDIFIGANALDYSGYTDCRPEYYRAWETLMKLATKVGVEDDQNFKIHTPLIHLHKAEIIKWGMRLGIDYSQTISCYRANALGHACGSCDSCTYRKKGFLEAGISDPTLYN